MAIVGTAPPDNAEAAPARRRWRWIWAALLAVVVFAAGYAVRSVQDESATPGDGSAEAGFARDMSTHHAQAVEMALIAWQHATRPDVRAMADATATSQQAQIGTMQAWLTAWHLTLTTTGAPMAWIPGGTSMLGPDQRMPGMASPTEMTQLRTARGPAVDVLFCQLMIRHHLGGIHMINAILTRTDRPEVLDLARAMKASQQADLTSMQDTLTTMGARP